MKESRRAVDNGRRPDATVTYVTLSARSSQMFVLRSLVVAVALEADFDLDTVDDLRLAVDEMCALLLARSGPGDLLHCQFETAPDSISVLATVRTDSARPVDTATFGWQMVSLLSDRADTWATPGELHIRIRRAKPR